ncbi:glycosyltransferase family 4 protein [Candidatus Woesearchaeota archaeon]|nr:glycosyltransferase family 4 protein [Candidatus Woesearchaeota archaeon]
MKPLYVLSRHAVYSGNGSVVDSLARYLYDLHVPVDVAVTSPDGVSVIPADLQREKHLQERLKAAEHKTLDDFLEHSQPYDIVHAHSMASDDALLAIVETLKRKGAGIVSTIHINHAQEYGSLRRRFEELHEAEILKEAKHFIKACYKDDASFDERFGQLVRAWVEGFLKVIREGEPRLKEDLVNYSYQSRLLRLSDHVIHLTRYGREMAEFFYGDELRGIPNPPIGNGISIIPADRSPPMRKSPSGTITLLYDGRISTEKGVVELAEAFLEVVEKHDDVRIIFHGDGDQQQVIREKLEPYSDRATFVPYHGPFNTGAELLTDGISIRNYLMLNSDLMVVPSHSETFCLAIAEGMHRKIPVLASDIRVFKEIYKDFVLMFERGNVESLAESIENFLQSPNSPAAQAMVNRAYEFSFKLAWERIARKHIALYNYVIEIDEVRRQV